MAYSVLNQCAKDAWDIIQGRKKIVENRIVDCDPEIDEQKQENTDYGWLAPNGKFYPVEFGNHQAWASQYLSDEYGNGNIESKCVDDPSDRLCEMGFILIHNPHGYNFSITRNYNKRITTRQEDFLIEYFEQRDMKEWLYKIYRGEL